MVVGALGGRPVGAAKSPPNESRRASRSASPLLWRALLVPWRWACLPMRCSAPGAGTSCGDWLGPTQSVPAHRASVCRGRHRTRPMA
jgi:hypothetical protein